MRCEWVIEESGASLVVRSQESGVVLVSFPNHRLRRLFESRFSENTGMIEEKRKKAK